MAAAGIPAEKLLKELGINEPEDIDIEAIAEYCRATVIPQVLHGSAGRILGFGDRAFITVDSQSPRSRQRFSAAHELGHWMLDRGRLANFVCTEKNFISDWSVDNPERRANKYAANLLLPHFIFQPLVKNREITFETVRDLCRRFETSLMATAIRLVELGSFPAIVVCNDRQGRLWTYRGGDVPSIIQVRETPGRYTDAYGILNGTISSPSPGEIEASDWITHPRSRHYSLYEDSVKVYDELVLTLLWWKNEKQLLDLDEDEDGYE